MAIATVAAAVGGEKVACTAGQSVSCVFNVTNDSAQAQRLSLEVRVEGAMHKGWLEVLGDIERGLPEAGTEQVTVNVKIPEATTPGKYVFRLRAYATDDPEQCAESPAVAVEVARPAPTPVPGPVPPPKPFPWWIAAVGVAIVVVVIGVIVYVKSVNSGLEVPDVVKLTLDAATARLDEAGLKVGDVVDEPTGAAAPGLVVRQKPVAGTQVKRGAAIRLTVAAGQAPPALEKLCVASGLVKSGAWASVASLPEDCQPGGRLIFNLNNHTKTARVDVQPSGEILWVAGGQDHSWISLSGMVFKPGSGGDGLALRNGWVNHGGEYRGARVARVGDLCVVSGLIKSGGWGTLALLPQECRPSGRLIFNLNNDAKTARVDVKASGEILWVAGGKDHGWISLDGIVFKPGSGGEGLALRNRWVNYGGEYRGARVARVGDLCVASGLIKSGGWGTLALLPQKCRPSGRLIFNLNNHANTARVDVQPSGEILWVAGGKDHSWISLDGIVFKPGSGGDELSLQNNWVNYSGGYRPAKVDDGGRTGG